MKKLLLAIAALFTASFAMAQTIEITVPNATYQTYSNMHQFCGSSDDGIYIVYFTYSGYEAAGHIVDSVFLSEYSAVFEGSSEHTISTVDVTVTAVGSGFTVDGNVTADGQVYHIMMSYGISAPTDTIEVVIPNAILNSDVDNSYMFNVSGKTSDGGIGVAISIMSNQVAGDYGNSNIMFDYTGVFYFEGSTQTSAVDILSTSDVNVVSVTITNYSPLTYSVEAYLHGSDGHCYHVLMTTGTVTINEAENVKVSLYPNPATDKINVVADGVQRIDIIDVNGRTVLSRTQAGEINLGELSRGLYMVRTMTNDGISTKKIVKK